MSRNRFVGLSALVPRNVALTPERLDALLKQSPSPSETKGTVMPSLQEALHKAIQTAPTPTIPAEWDDEGSTKVVEISATPALAPAPAPAPTSSVHASRTIFDIVSKHPGIERDDCVAKAVTLGVVRGSATSLVAQFVTAGIFEYRQGGLFAKLTEYESPSTAIRRLRREAEEKAEAQRRAEITAKRLATRMANKNKLRYEKPAKPAPAPAPAAVAVSVPDPVVVATFDPAEIVESLTLRQARAVYDELKKIFG